MNKIKEYFQLFLLLIDSVMHWFKSLFYGIKNLKYYFKVIYTDRNNDFLYIYRLELCKIQGIINYYQTKKSSKISSKKELILRDLLLAKYLLKMLLDEPSCSTSSYTVQGYKFIRFNKYVNFLNAKRFVGENTLKHYIKAPEGCLVREVNKMHLYKIKCLYLYNKLKSYKSYKWED